MNAETEMRFEQMQAEIDRLQGKFEDTKNELDEHIEALKSVLVAVKANDAVAINQACDEAAKLLKPENATAQPTA